MEPIIGGETQGGAQDLIKDADINTFMKDVIEASQKTPVIVDFWADWCGPCKQLAPLLEKAVREAGGVVRLVKVNVDENQQLAAQLQVQSLPTVMAFKNGQPVDGFAGVVPESQIKDFIKRLGGESEGNSLEDQIKSALAMAEEAIKQNQTDTAIDIYQQIIAADSENTAAHAGLIRTLAAKGRLEEARSHLDGLSDKLKVHADIEAATSAIEMAEAARNAGDVGELEEKVADNPDDMDARLQLAKALAAHGRNEEAGDHLITMIAKDKSWNEGAARQQLVKMFEAAGHTDPFTLTYRRKLSTILFS